MTVRVQCGSAISIVEGGQNGNGGGNGDNGNGTPVEGLPKWLKIAIGTAAGGVAGSVLV